MLAASADRRHDRRPGPRREVHPWSEACLPSRATGAFRPRSARRRIWWCMGSRGYTLERGDIIRSTLEWSTRLGGRRRDHSCAAAGQPGGIEAHEGDPGGPRGGRGSATPGTAWATCRTPSRSASSGRILESAARRPRDRPRCTRTRRSREGGAWPRAADRRGDGLLRRADGGAGRQAVRMGDDNWAIYLRTARSPALRARSPLPRWAAILTWHLKEAKVAA
jgi:hypothetical protein